MPTHLMLPTLGPTSIHRPTWVFMDNLPSGVRLPEPIQEALFPLEDLT